MRGIGAELEGEIERELIYAEKKHPNQHLTFMQWRGQMAKQLGECYVYDEIKDRKMSKRQLVQLIAVCIRALEDLGLGDE